MATFQLQRFLLNVRPTGRVIVTSTDSVADDRHPVEELEVSEDGLICVGKKVNARVSTTAPEVDVSEKMVEECSLLFSLRHPNIIQYLGLCFLHDSGMPTVVMEYMPHSLDQLLKMPVDIPPSVKHSIAGDITRGLTYLHSRSPPVVHGKLAASNILLTSAIVAKVSDIGDSLHTKLPQQLQTTGTLSFPYLPPEVTDGLPYTKPVDIFLFGELLLYIILQEVPVIATPSFIQGTTSEVLCPEEQCRLLLIERLSRVPGGGCGTHPVVRLVEWCLQSEPGKRPSAREILNELREGWVEVECPSEQVLKWGLMVSMKLLGSEFQLPKTDLQVALAPSEPGEDEIDLEQDMVTAECPSASEVLNELREGWVEVECPSEQVLKWGLMVSMKQLGAEIQSEIDASEPVEEVIDLEQDMTEVEASGPGEDEFELEQDWGGFDASEPLETECELAKDVTDVEGSGSGEDEFVLEQNVGEIKCTAEQVLEATATDVVVTEIPEESTATIQGPSTTRHPRHPKSQARKRPFHKRVCVSRLTCFSSLKRRQQNLKEKKTEFQCKTCKNVFSSSTSLKRHACTHAREKPFQCEVCEGRFTTSPNLKRHKLTHTGKEPFPCKVCGVRFTRPRYLKRHAMTHARFTTSFNLKEHKLVTHAGKMFWCEVCEGRFTTPAHLKRHKLTHTGEKLFQCDVCKVRFTRRCHVKHHKLIHTGEWPFQCEVCEATFTAYSSLEQHKLTHMEGFQCDLCEARFPTPSDLKRHKRTHTGERPFRYVRLDSPGLTTSKCITTGKEPFPCKVCGARFTRPRYLKQHSMTHTV